MNKSEIIEIIKSAAKVSINGDTVSTDDLLLQPDHVVDLRDKSFWYYDDIETCEVVD